ncbi:DNA polymerase III subunit gamma/tau [Chloroflexota bacterium]
MSVFYRKWRPQTLTEVVGQEPVTRTLHNALSLSRVSHAYLFCGPRGTGKTSTGRILAKAVNCLINGQGEPCNTCYMCQAITEGHALDVIEIDAASNRGIDEIRELRERVNYAPNESRYKVYIIDEVHMLTKEASNALLKTLEEPPPQVIFILATTEAHKVLPTILSRCQRFDFRRVSQADVVTKLTHICSEEGLQVEPEALLLIARNATGSLRDAENILEQMATYYGTEIGLHQVQVILGITGDWRAKELIKHIIGNDISAGITTINSVNGDGLDLRQFNREVVSYLRDLLLIKTGSQEIVDFTPEDKAELESMAAKTSLVQILRAVKRFGEVGLGSDNYSTLPLELALVDCILASEEKGGESPKSKPEARRVKEVTPPPMVTSPEPAPVKVTPPPEPPPLVSASDPEPPAEKAVSSDVPESDPMVASEDTPLLANEVERLQLNWKRIIEEAPPDIKRTNAVALLRSAGVKPVEIKDDTITLAFKYNIHKENVEKMENKQVAERMISSYLGRPCRVRCIYQPENNHLVKAALRMGAEIVDVEEK